MVMTVMTVTLEVATPLTSCLHRQLWTVPPPHKLGHAMVCHTEVSELPFSSQLTSRTVFS